MPKLTVFFFLLLLSITTIAQHKKVENDCPKVMDAALHKYVYTMSEKMSGPLGGANVLYRTIETKLKPPPPNLQIDTRVMVKVVVGPNGKLLSKKLMNDPKGMALFFGKDIPAILEDVKWQPGECNGKKVPMYYIFPINIELADY